MQIKSKKIRQLMADKNLSLVDVAIKAGISATRLAILLSKEDAPPEIANGVAKAVGVKYTEVIGRES